MTSVNILGVTITDKLSVSDHVRHVIASCAPMLHALRVMRCHGMNNAALKTVYQTIVCRHRLVGVHHSSRPSTHMLSSVHREIRAGFCDKNMPAVSELVQDADDALFERAMRDRHHDLYHLFPDHKTEFKYDLRPHRHEFTSSQKFGRL